MSARLWLLQEFWTVDEAKSDLIASRLTWDTPYTQGFIVSQTTSNRSSNGERNELAANQCDRGGNGSGGRGGTYRNAPDCHFAASKL